MSKNIRVTFLNDKLEPVVICKVTNFKFAENDSVVWITGVQWGQNVAADFTINESAIAYIKEWDSLA